MPHDRNGKLLEVGSDVVIRGRVTMLTTSDEYCNCDVELAPMPPYTTPYKIVLNTRQVELVPEGSVVSILDVAIRHGVNP